MHASIPIYSGGLGILAGDHFKEASDLGIPLVGVGLFYQKGYFRQRMTEDGRQLAIEEPFDPESMAIRKVWGNGEEGAHATVTLDGRTVHLGVWEMLIGRSSIYLLDTDIERNDPEDRKLSHQLYSGDNEMRLRQEIVLGIGGVRVLRALDIHPEVWHANEGHAAFMTLETVPRVRRGRSLVRTRPAGGWPRPPCSPRTRPSPRDTMPSRSIGWTGTSSTTWTGSACPGRSCSLWADIRTTTAASTCPRWRSGCRTAATA